VSTDSTRARRCVASSRRSERGELAVVSQARLADHPVDEVLDQVGVALVDDGQPDVVGGDSRGRARVTPA
jgi:hypothetical protein